VNIFGDKYSSLYNLFHANKNYRVEVDNLLKIIGDRFLEPKFLDFGCGSGLHAAELAQRGFNVVGYDLSEEMIQRAKTNNPNLRFESNIENLNAEFDITYSLFDVMSYQITAETLKHYFIQIASLTKNGGLVVIDSWHQSGVRLSPPIESNRIVELGGKHFERSVVPRDSGVEDQYDLQISVRDISQEGILALEMHQLRAWSLDELLIALDGLDLTLISTFNPKNLDEPVLESSWRFGVVLSKTGKE
jgi:SAM-dependent methyltransferase